MLTVKKVFARYRRVLEGYVRNHDKGAVILNTYDNYVKKDDIDGSDRAPFLQRCALVRAKQYSELAMLKAGILVHSNG